MENPFEEKQMKRPTFLTVLCILTFIGSGWGILSELFSLITAGMVNQSVQMEQYTQAMDQLADSGVSSSFISGLLSSSQEVIQASMMYRTQIAVCGLILSVISLIGALLMFRLKRIGFYFYTAAQVLMLGITPIFIGFSLITITSLIFSAIFALLFIILYAVNLKYMK